MSDVKWPNTPRNEEAYRRTRAIEWTTTIRKRPKKRIGRIIRADYSTPTVRVFNYAIVPYLRPRDKSVLISLRIIRTNIEKLNLTWNKAINIAAEIQTWEAIINNFKL